MSDLTIYGTLASRATRNIWMALELGIDYSLESVDIRKGEQKGDDYLAINPNARVPALREGDLVLWESLAINLYLAKKHGGKLAPLSLEDEARAIQWSMWALTEAENHCVVMIQKAMRHADVAIERGENSGKTITYVNAVLDYQTIGMWEGAGLTVDIPHSELAAKEADGCAVLLQKATDGGHPGAIIGAAILPRQTT